MKCELLWTTNSEAENMKVRCRNGGSVSVDSGTTGMPCWGGLRKLGKRSRLRKRACRNMGRREGSGRWLR